MVLANKLLMQATNTAITLGCSPVNNDAYVRWFYKIQMIVCTNKWEEQLAEIKKKSLSDWKWLTTNAIVCEVQEGTLIPRP